ncbi:MAG: hypothetical protein N3A66_05535, partial [Planctomycetota bacterium]|nr:hypothetical protein [Planctomycetota bacterium]
PDGLVPRLADAAARAVDPRAGALAFDRYRLAALRGGEMGIGLAQAIRRYHEVALHGMLLSAGVEAARKAVAVVG